MDALPDDIKALIIRFLREAIRDETAHTRRWLRPPLARYAGISLAWNAAVEREVFRDVYVTSDSLDRFFTIVAKDPAGRFAAIRRLQFVVFTTVPGVRSIPQEELFSRHVERLFGMLAELERRREQVEGLLVWQGGVMRRRIRPPELRLELTTFRKRDEPHLLYLGGKLPRLTCVREFVLSERHHVWPESVVQIAAAMEGLRRCTFTLDDAPTEDPRVRLEYREALGNVISRVPESCDEVHADFLFWTRNMERQAIVPLGGLDSLSIGLRELSTRLRFLKLHRLALSTSLFWPGENEEEVQLEPMWPNLQHYEVHFEPMTAGGEWFAKEDPLAGPAVIPEADLLSPQETWPEYGRPILDYDLANALFLAAGQAAQNMPSLKYMQLVLAGVSDSRLGFKFQHDPERKRFVAIWGSDKELRISSDVLQAWRCNEEKLKITDGGTCLEAEILWRIWVSQPKH